MKRQQRKLLKKIRKKVKKELASVHLADQRGLVMAMINDFEGNLTSL